MEADKPEQAGLDFGGDDQGGGGEQPPGDQGGGLDLGNM